jgi:hypothetical protein
MPHKAHFHPGDVARLPQIVGADLTPGTDRVIYAATTRDGNTALDVLPREVGDNRRAVNWRESS